MTQGQELIICRGWVLHTYGFTPSLKWSEKPKKECGTDFG